ncbi:MAG TPA: transposase [Streptosporangiaceae bacterium]
MLPRPAGRTHRLGPAHPRDPVPPGRAPAFHRLRHADGPGQLTALAREHLSPAGQAQIAVCLRMLAALEAELTAVRHRLLAVAAHLRGAKALSGAHLRGRPGHRPGVHLLAGRRWPVSSARKAVRFCGLDITVYSSDSKRPPGYLSRQGPPVLRWCAYEAGKTHAHTTAPDHPYYAAVKDRAGGKRAALAEARKIVRRACHILTELGDDAFTRV